MAVPNLWRTKHERYSLQGLVCPECSQVVFPPRLVCPHCQQLMNGSSKSSAPKTGKRDFLFTMPLPVAPELRVAADD